MNRLRTLVLAVGLLSNVVGYAHDFEVDGIYYNITSSDDLTVEVTYRGDYGDSYDEYHDVISIPSSVVYNLNTYRVTSIGNSAFHSCGNLISAIIPEGVVSIGSSAFNGCTNLVSIMIPKSVTSMGTSVFYGCNDIKSLVVGGNVSAIGNKAFSSPCKVIWLTNNPPTGYEETNGMINYVPNEKYTKLSSKKVYPYLSSLFEIGGTIFVPNPAEKTCDVIDCNYLGPVVK